MSDWGEVCRQALQIGAGLWLQSTLLLAVGLGAGWLMRKRGPLFEVAVCKASLCAVLLGALLGAALAGRVRPIWRIALPAIQSPPSVTASPSIPGADTGIPVQVSTATRLPQRAVVDEPHARAISGQAHGLSWSSAYAGLAVVWLVVSLAQLVWFLPGAIALARIRKMRPAGEGERVSMLLQEMSLQAGIAVPRLIVHEEMRSPFVAGVLRPMIVLPSHMIGLDEPLLRGVLSHELGHVIAKDSAWSPLFRIVMALAWPQPLLRILHLRWLSASEHACDVRALSGGCSPMVYAECLVRLSEERQSLRAVHALAVGIMPFQSLLGRRVQQILFWKGGAPNGVSRRARYVQGCAVILAGCATVFLVPGSSVVARATTRSFSTIASPQISSPPAAPVRPAPRLNHDATVKRGAAMKRNASRTLSTVAAIAGGLTQTNFPSIAAPAASPDVHIGQPAPLKVITGSDAEVQVAKTTAGDLLVSINCRNAPAPTVIEKVFKAAGVGYSMPSQFAGNVTLQARSLPINAALRALLRSSDQSLTYDVIENVYVIKPETRLPVAPQVTAAPPSSAAGGSSDTTASAHTDLHWYKIVLLNSKSQDVADALEQDGAIKPGVSPSDVTILALPKDNSVLIHATPEEFAKLRDRIRDLERPIH